MKAKYRKEFIKLLNEASGSISFEEFTIIDNKLQPVKEKPTRKEILDTMEKRKDVISPVLDYLKDKQLRSRKTTQQRVVKQKINSIDISLRCGIVEV